MGPGGAAQITCPRGRPRVLRRDADYLDLCDQSHAELSGLQVGAWGPCAHSFPQVKGSCSSRLYPSDGTSLVAQTVKNLPAMQETQV